MLALRHLLLVFIAATELLANLLNVEVEAQMPPSLVGALEISVLENAKEAYMTYVLKQLSNIDIPDVYFKGGYLKGITFETGGNPNKLEFYLRETENAFCIRSEDITADVVVAKIYYGVAGVKFKGAVRYYI